jgi:hypothetical protein
MNALRLMLAISILNLKCTHAASLEAVFQHLPAAARPWVYWFAETK